MKLFLITLLISITCVAEEASWPFDNDKNLPSLLDPNKPYIDITVEENKYLENISRQIIEQNPEPEPLVIEKDSESTPNSSEEVNSREPSNFEELSKAPTVEE